MRRLGTRVGTLAALGLVGAFLLLAGVPAGALASTTFTLSRAQIVTANPGGVYFAGGEPALSDGHGGLVRLDAGGRSTPVANSRHGVGPSLVLGSDGYLAVVDGNEPGGALYLGSVGGALSEVSACADAQNPPVLTDQALVYGDDGCDGSPTIKLLDLRSGAPELVATYADATPPQPGSAGSGPSLAGDYVAYLAGQQIVVRNWTTGQTVQSVTPEAPTGQCGPEMPLTQTPQKRVCAFAVDADGSLWQLTDTVDYSCDADCMSSGKYGPFPSFVDSCNGRIDRTTPDGTSETIATPVCGEAGMRVANGRALYAKPPPGNGAYPGLINWVAGTDGTSSPLGAPSSMLAFTGTTMTYTAVDCNSETVNTVSVPQGLPIPPGHDPFSCPVTLSHPRLHLGQRPLLSLIVRCKLGCVGPLVVGVPAAGGPIAGTSSAFTLAAGAQLRLAIPLRRASLLVRQAKRRTRLTVGFWELSLDYDPHAIGWFVDRFPPMTRTVPVAGHPTRHRRR